jgi:oligosaccharide repeat unit polymerase
MTEKNLGNRAKNLFFIPSFYGALTWGVWLFLYSTDLIMLDKCSNKAMAIFVFTEAMFVIATYVFFSFFKEIPTAYKSSFRIKVSLIMFHVLGFVGLAFYILDFSENMGGISGFLFALQSEAHTIRWEAVETITIGTQLSYFGWIAIALTVYHFACKRISRYWVAIAVMQFLGNFLFIDRTRPLWILLTSIFMILPVVRKLQVKEAFRWAVFSTILAGIIFWGVAEWTGKKVYEGKYGDTPLPGIVQEFYFYGSSGFAYFSKMIESNNEISYIPERIFYPAFKVLAKLELVEEPPNQILDFYEVPFPTNVGTFLEPFYSDGGLIYTFFGIIICSFGFNLAGLFLLRSRQPMAIYAWSNICFAAFLAFFTPKIVSFPFWLFMGLGFISMLMRILAPQSLSEERHGRVN